MTARRKKPPTSGQLEARALAAEHLLDAERIETQRLRDDLAAARAHVAALRQCLQDVLATIPHEYAKPEVQLVRMRARCVAAEPVESGRGMKGER